MQQEDVDSTHGSSLRVGRLSTCIGMLLAKASASNLTYADGAGVLGRRSRVGGVILDLNPYYTGISR